MAGNKRGKLKEHFEGIHRNFDWILYHVNSSLKLIEDQKPNLSEGIKQLGEAAKTLDDMAKEVYDRL